MAGETVFTVTRLNEYAARILSNDPRLRSIKVSGEIGGFKRYPSGHLYFSLKDEEAVISCVMFRSYASKLGFSPREGMRVVVHGSVSIYAKDGKYQLYADAMREDGEGELYRQFLLLKAKLESEGLFENERPLPVLPRVIGVATSPAGAALHDIVNIIRRRFPGMNVLLAPCQVQGAAAPAEIAAAIRALQRFEKCDVIIVGRGGGSYEDLSCFNDEAVARAIAGSKIPVVSAVGHETDFTIADFAADLRAPTPSAAAELCCPVYADIVYSLAEFEEDIRSAASDRLDECGAKLAALKSSSAMANPVHALELLRERLASKKAGIESAASAGLKNAAFLLKNRVDTLKALSPDSVLERGYSIVTDADGRMLKSASELRKNETIKVKMANGCASAVVTGVDMR